MIIGVIGYRNHSKKIIDFVLRYKKVNKILIYCYKKNKLKKLKSDNKNKKIEYCQDLESFNDINAVFITSPNDTHIKYINVFPPHAFILPF